MQKAVDVYLSAVKELISVGSAKEVERALALLKELDESKKIGIDTELILLKGRVHNNERDFHITGISDRQDYKREVARIKYALLSLVDDVPSKIKLNSKVAGVAGWDFDIPNDAQLEKIIGDTSNLFKISWLEKAIKAAKSVCRVVCNDGSMGTGFLIEGNYLITNNHVLPNASMAAGAEIEFNFEEDISGALKQKYTYRLDSNDFVTNTSRNLDFTRVKVLESPGSEPLSFWGHLDVSSDITPIKDAPVTIIQHPKGKEKHIALTANEVLAVQGNKVLYKTDTEPGSSGSPVFDKDWNVVALHHAGKLLQDGGLRIRETGQRVSANRGIIFKYINEFLRKADGDAAPAPTPVANPSPTPDSPDDDAKANLGFGAGDADGDQKNENHSPDVEDDANKLPLVFLMYDNKDRDFAEELRGHLTPLESILKEIVVDDMHEGKLAFGNNKKRWQEKIESSAIILCLITPTFFISKDKVFALAEHAENKGKVVVPVLIKATPHYEKSFLGDLGTLPSNKEFISNWSDRDSAYTEIVDTIQNYINSL